MSFSEEDIQSVWEKGKKIPDKNPDLYREDSLGNVIYRHSYGVTTAMGWEIDHSKPQAKGGTDHLNNLQPLYWKANREKSDKY
jgi:hypothetical protein